MENYRKLIEDTFQEVASKQYLIDTRLYFNDRYCVQVSLYPNTDSCETKEPLKFLFVDHEQEIGVLEPDELWWVRKSNSSIVNNKVHWTDSEPNRFKIQDFKKELKNAI
jgi:hypothetical protein